jgi:hypothetical protein
MIHNNSYVNDDVSFEESEISLPRPVRFWLLLLLNIPSTICSFVLLFHLLINKTSRYQLTNHVIIILLIIGLIIELVDIPFHLSFLHLGIVQPSAPILCQIWWFIDFGLYSGCTIIIAFGSIERYFLVFHDRVFLNKNKRLIFHYLPYIILLRYILIFYIIAVFFPPCTNTYGYTLPVCNESPCYLNNPLLGIWDSVLNNILPTIIISVSSVIIVTKVYYQKRRLHQVNVWRKQRKMAIQLFSISVLYLIPNIPFNTVLFVHLCGVSKSIGFQVQLYFDFLCYFPVLLYPFVCLGSLSELRKKIKWRRLFLLRQPRHIAIVRPQ